MPWGEPCVDGVQEDLNPTHMLRGILQEIRQRAEQMSEQRVRSALRSEVEGQLRHLDREPEFIEVGWSKVEDELRTDARTIFLSELVYQRC